MIRKLALLFVVSYMTIGAVAHAQTYNGPAQINGYSIYYVLSTWNNLSPILNLPNQSLPGVPTGTYFLPWDHDNTYTEPVTVKSYLDGWINAQNWGDGVKLPNNPINYDNVTPVRPGSSIILKVVWLARFTDLMW